MSLEINWILNGTDLIEPKPPIFESFPKIPRLSRECVITEKIDGTNAQIVITSSGNIYAGSRSRYITPKDDNYGFAMWVENNANELLKLGEGRHFGEWWGKGINRGYDKQDRTFSLFNALRWIDNPELPKCCSVVPLLHRGLFDTNAINETLEALKKNGSVAAPGYKNPEGIIIFHLAAGFGFKKTIFKDEEHKGK